MDVAQYVRAANQKAGADEAMVASAKAVGQSLAEIDAAAKKATPGVSSLSRSYIEGYSQAAKFESAIRSVGNALDRGMDPARAAAALDGVYRKFGQTADAARLAQQGYVSLAPVVQALNSHMAATAEIADRAAAATSRLAQAQATQSRINASFGIGAAPSASARASASAFLEADQQAVAKLNQAYNPLIVNEERRNKALREATALQSRGSLSGEQYEATIANINRVHDDTKRALEGAYTATGKYTSGVGLARHELINLGRQVQDVGVSLASGQSFTTVLIQQGTQIADIFAASRGSVVGFFRSLPAMIAPALGPIAAVVAGATAIYSAFAVLGERQALSNSLLGIGRAAGVSGDAFDQLAKDASVAADTTVSKSRLIAAEYARLGQLATSSLPQLAKITKDYARVTGQDAPEAAKELAAAFRDPVRGAEMLSEKLGALDSTTLRAIRTASDYGDRLRAQKLLMDEVARATEGAENAQSKFDQAWERFISKPLDRAKQSIGNALIGPNDRERLAEINSELATLEQRLQAGTSAPGKDYQLKAEIANLRQRRSELEATLKVEDEAARNRAKRVEGNQRVNSADGLLQGAQRDELAYRLATQAITAYEKSIEELTQRRNALVASGDTGAGLDARKFAEINSQIKEQSIALERAKAQAADYAKATGGLTTEQIKANAAADIRMKAANDATVAERRATAEALARNDMLGTATTAQERDNAAKLAAKQIDADAARSAAESRRSANDNVQSLGREEAAVRSLGSASADVAKLRQQAVQISRSTGENQSVVLERLMREEIARTNKELTLKVAQSKEAAAVEASVNAATRSGNLSETQRSELLQRRNALEQERRQLIAVGITDQSSLNQRLTEYGNALAAANTEAVKGRALGMLYGQAEQISMLELEIASIGKNEAERARLVATMRAEQDLRRQGISLKSEEGQAYLANAQRIAEMTTLRDRMVEIQNIGRDALKGFLSDLRQGKSASEALKNALDRVADKLFDIASNQITNGLFGTSSGSGGWLASIVSALFGGSSGGSAGGGWATVTQKSAKGHAFDYGNVIPFARGGAFTNRIVDRPTLFPFAKGTGLMGEAGPEAIMPLRRDSAGRLGVAAAQGGAQFNMQVINNAGAEVKTEKRKNDSGGFDIVTMIDTAVADRISTPGSDSRRAFQTQFGGKTQLTRR